MSQITHIIITHFTAVHSLEITRIISTLLIYVQPGKYLDDQLKNRFIHVYRGLLEETLHTIEKHIAVHPYLAEVLEYDIKALASSVFSLEPVVKTDSALLFNSNFIENDTLPFYQQIPETSPSVARYQVVKVLLLRRVSQRLIEECDVEEGVDRYYDKVRGSVTSKIKPGEYLRMPISVSSYRCKLEDGKISIPNW